MNDNPVTYVGKANPVDGMAQPRMFPKRDLYNVDGNVFTLDPATGGVALYSLGIRFPLVQGPRPAGDRSADWFWPAAFDYHEERLVA